MCNIVPFRIKAKKQQQKKRRLNHFMLCLVASPLSRRASRPPKTTRQTLDPGPPDLGSLGRRSSPPAAIVLPTAAAGWPP